MKQKILYFYANCKKSEKESKKKWNSANNRKGEEEDSKEKKMIEIMIDCSLWNLMIVV